MLGTNLQTRVQKYTLIEGTFNIIIFRVAGEVRQYITVNENPYTSFRLRPDIEFFVGDVCDGFRKSTNNKPPPPPLKGKQKPGGRKRKKKK